MQHLAIDLGGRESQICIRNSSGEILREAKVSTRSLPKLFQKEPTSRVIVETCSEAFAVADAALSCKHEVRVVPATLVRTLGVGARKVKTDQRDARVLSEVSTRIDLPSVHIPSELSREWKSRCSMRTELVRARTGMVNTVRGWGRARLLKIPSGSVETFPKRAADAAMKTGYGLPDFVQGMLDSIAFLNQQIATADKELLALVKEHPICSLLMTTPGVGSITSLRFVATVDDVSRFSSASLLQSYLGLTPGENSSSERKQRTGITKAGPSELRSCLVQAAWTLRRTRPHDPIAKWAMEIEKRRGKFVATVAVARKLAGVLYALWRDGAKYNAHHTAAAKQTAA